MGRFAAFGWRTSPRARLVLRAAEALDALGHVRGLVDDLREAHDRDRVLQCDVAAVDLLEELDEFLEQIYGREVTLEDTVTVVRFSQIVDKPSDMTERIKGFGGAQN